MLHFSLTLLLISSSYHTATSSNSTESRLELNVEKECSEFGASAGRLEWRAWRDAGTLAARCDLHGHAPRTSYAISWTRAHDADDKNVLKACEFDQKDLNASSEIYCEYKMEVSSSDDGADRGLLCWVKTTNEWKSESRTACISDNISLREFESYLRMRAAADPPAPPAAVPPAPPRAVGVEELRWGQRYKTDSEAESDTENFNKKYKWLPDQPWKPYDHYIVDIGPDVVTECNVTDDDMISHQILWVVSALHTKDTTPQGMVWNATMSYDGRISGNFTLYLRKGKLSNKGQFIPYGLQLKRCNRTQESYRVPIQCSLILPISNSDVGQHAFFASFKYQRNRNWKDPWGKPVPMQYCDVDDQFVSYNITMDPAWTRRRKIEKIPVVFNVGGRKRGNRTGLPWSTKPVQGPGVRLNGAQYVTISSGAALGVMSASSCWLALAGMMRRRRRNLEALPCHCRERRPRTKRRSVVA